MVAVYGAYFHGGLGILLMARYTVTGESRLATVNALKNLTARVLSWLAVAAFFLHNAGWARSPVFKPALCPDRAACRA